MSLSENIRGHPVRVPSLHFHPAVREGPPFGVPRSRNSYTLSVEFGQNP